MMIMLRIAMHRRMVQSRIHYSCAANPPVLTADSQHTGSTITTCKGSTFPIATLLSWEPQQTMTMFHCIESQRWIQRCARINSVSLQANKLVGPLVDSPLATQNTRASFFPRHCNRQHISQQTIDGTGRRSSNATV